MQALGYEADKNGVCNGVALTGMIAFFCEQYPQFSALLQTLETHRNHHPDDFLQQLRALHQKRIDNRLGTEPEAFSQAEKNLLPFRVLFENMEFAFMPSRYRAWFANKEYVNQMDGEAIAAVLCPARKIKNYLSHPGIYKKDELRAYFSKMMSLASSKKVNFSLQLGSSDHAISLLYDARSDAWHLIDASNNTQKTCKSAEEIVKNLFASFEERNIVGFTTNYYGLEADKQTLLALVSELTASKEFKTAHEVSKIRSTYRTSQNVDLAFLASQNGLTEVIRALHDVGANFNNANNNGNTPIFVAAQNGHTDSIRALHAGGSDVNKTNNQGSTPAITAAQNGHFDAILALYEAKADLNESNKDGNTPLIVAAEKGAVDIIYVLLACHVDVNKSNNNGFSAVSMAALKGHVAAIHALYKARADVNKANVDGFTPAHLAAAQGSVEVINALKACKANLNQTDYNGVTPAFLAAQFGHVDVLSALYQHGADLNQADAEGFTPAMIAAQNGHVHVIRALHAMGADLNKVTNQGNTLAFMAAKNGHAHVIRALYAAKVDLNQANKSGITPAMIAAHNGQATVIRTLHTFQIDLNQADTQGFTLAHIAANQGHAEVITALYKAKVDLNKVNNDGLTPAATAVYSGDLPVLKALAAGGVDFSSNNNLTKQSYLDLARERHQVAAIRFLENLQPVDIGKISRASILLAREISRLNPYQESRKWFNFFYKSSDQKIMKLRQLKESLDACNQEGSTRGDVQRKLCQWHTKANVAIIKEQRNILHAFFMPYHQAESEKLVKRIFRAFDVKE